MSRAFRFLLEPVLDHRTRREELAQRELASAIAALARQEEAAVAAELVVESQVARLRALSGETNELWRLRACHEAIVAARRRAAHERAACEQLDVAARARREKLVKASQDRAALAQVEKTQRERHLREARRIDAERLDEIAVQRSARTSVGGRNPASTDDHGMVLMS